MHLPQVLAAVVAEPCKLETVPALLDQIVGGFSEACETAALWSPHWESAVAESGERPFYEACHSLALIREYVLLLKSDRWIVVMA